MRWRVYFLALAGCGRISFTDVAGGDAGGDADRDGAADAPTAGNGGFANPILIAGTVGADPQLRADGLELWVADGNPYDLLSATRPSRTAAFGAFAVDPVLTSVDAETDPSLSGDGLTMMFIVDTPVLRRAYEVRRTSTSAPWGAPALVSGLEAEPVASIDLLPDGNTLYYTDSNLALRRTQRATSSAPFPSAAYVDGPWGTRFITVSSDERLLFYNSTDAGWTRWATRATTSEPFVDRGAFDGVPGCGPTQSADADIAPDQRTLVIRCPDIYALTRP